MLLQTTELTQTATEAAKQVGGHAGESGFLSLLWLLVVLLSLITVIMYVKAEKEVKEKEAGIIGREEAIATALAKAAEQNATEQALNSSHQQALNQQLREQYERQIGGLREDRNALQQQVNAMAREMREQENKSTDIFHALTAKLTEMTRLLSDMQYRLQCIDAAAANRPQPAPQRNQ